MHHEAFHTNLVRGEGLRSAAGSQLRPSKPEARASSFIPGLKWGEQGESSARFLYPKGERRNERKGVVKYRMYYLRFQIFSIYSYYLLLNVRIWLRRKGFRIFSTSPAYRDIYTHTLVRMYARKYVTCKLRRHFDQLQMPLFLFPDAHPNSSLSNRRTEALHTQASLNPKP